MFSYFGSKYKLAKHYGRPQHDLVIEPFAGSAGYSLFWEPENVLLVDKNPDICAIWRYLIGVHEHEILFLPTKFDNVEEIKVSEDAKKLIGFWIARGQTSPMLKKSVWGIEYQDDRQCKVWSDAAKFRIASQLKKIRHWRIFEGCYSIIENQKAHWFIDPPYEKIGHKYPFKNINYDQLATWCQNRQGFVQVCEQKDAQWLPFIPFRNVNSFHSLKEHGGREIKVSREVLYQQ